jgi:hypothetical protein
MSHTRRLFVAAGIGLGLAGTLASTAANAALPNLVPDSNADQTDVLQRLVDDAALRRQPLILPAGRINHFACWHQADRQQWAFHIEIHRRRGGDPGVASQ